AFRIVCSAVLERRQLGFEYRARSTGEKTRRTVSPQRITHYRDNWYLDAWDHEREGLRSFSVDRISGARMLEAAARDIEEATLDEHLSGSYGIFSGAPKGWATIVFNERAARWVADEHWHAQQQGRWLPDGRYELKVPYSNARELLMDVLHYGADAEILEPAPLREQARALLALALSNYDRRHAGGRRRTTDRTGTGVRRCPRTGADRGDRGDRGARAAHRLDRRYLHRRAGRRAARRRQARRLPRLAAGHGPQRDAAAAGSGL